MRLSNFLAFDKFTRTDFSQRGRERHLAISSHELLIMRNFVSSDGTQIMSRRQCRTNNTNRRITSVHFRASMAILRETT
jgi:hypothetical protein